MFVWRNGADLENVCHRNMWTSYHTQQNRRTTERIVFLPIRIVCVSIYIHRKGKQFRFRLIPIGTKEKTYAYFSLLVLLITLPSFNKKENEEFND